jgi:hypothetical protein
MLLPTDGQKQYERLTERVSEEDQRAALTPPLHRLHKNERNPLAASNGVRAANEGA